MSSNSDVLQEMSDALRESRKPAVAPVAEKEKVPPVKPEVTLPPKK